MRKIGIPEIEDIATGAALLGAGGGGDRGELLAGVQAPHRPRVLRHAAGEQRGVVLPQRPQLRPAERAERHLLHPPRPVREADPPSVAIVDQPQPAGHRLAGMHRLHKASSHRTNPIDSPAIPIAGPAMSAASAAKAAAAMPRSPLTATLRKSQGSGRRSRRGSGIRARARRPRGPNRSAATSGSPGR